MRYVVSLGDREFGVEIRGDVALLDGGPGEARLESRAHSPVSHLLRDGETRQVVATYHDGSWSIQVAGRTWSAEVEDERTHQIRAMSAAGSAPDHHRIVRAPMPGLVLRWVVEEGDVVKRGAGLVVLEAMKMENEIRAPDGGVVTNILVPAGTAVEKGASLVEIDPPS